MGFWSGLHGWMFGSATKQHRDEQLTFPSTVPISTGRQINEDSALQHSAVWACVRLLTETVSALPLNVYSVSGGNREIAEGSNLHRLLHSSPNSRMTSQEFREVMMLNLCLHGNAYAKIDKNAGKVVAIYPLASGQVIPRILADGTLIYEYRNENNVSIFSESSILHIKLFGNGVVGLSPLAYARVSIGLGMSAEDYASRYYINGGKPGGILTIDSVLSEEQRDLVRKNFTKLTEGSENAHRLVVLEAGMKYSQTQINPEDMQMIETRRFQLEDIARFFGVPSFLINDTEKTTTWGSGIEHMMLGFYNLSLKPYLSRWEQALEKSLLSPGQRGKFEIEFDFDDLLRGDSNAQAGLFSQYAQNGVMTRNEIRAKKKLKPLPGGDDLTVQVNLTPADKLGQENGNQALTTE